MDRFTTALFFQETCGFMAFMWMLWSTSLHDNRMLYAHEKLEEVYREYIQWDKPIQVALMIQIRTRSVRD